MGTMKIAGLLCLISTITVCLAKDVPMTELLPALNAQSSSEDSDCPCERFKTLCSAKCGGDENVAVNICQMNDANEVASQCGCYRTMLQVPLFIISARRFGPLDQSASDAQRIDPLAMLASFLDEARQSREDDADAQRGPLTNFLDQVVIPRFNALTSSSSESNPDAIITVEVESDSASEDETYGDDDNDETVTGSIFCFATAALVMSLMVSAAYYVIRKCCCGVARCCCSRTSYNDGYEPIPLHEFSNANAPPPIFTFAERQTEFVSPIFHNSAANKEITQTVHVLVPVSAL